MADGLLEAVRGLRLAHPELGPKPLLAKLREQQPDLGAARGTIREKRYNLSHPGVHHTYSCVGWRSVRHLYARSRRRTSCTHVGMGKKKCEHGRQRSQCKDCGGGSICEHGRRRSTCKECGGASICEHGRQRSKCKECGGGSICEHGQQRSRCKDCGGGGHVIFVEATEVEELDGEEDPDEWVATVQARLVGKPSGGKGKRKR